MDKFKLLRTSEPKFDGNELKYVSDCFKNNWISHGGKYTKLFEEKFAKFAGTKYAIAVSSGTASLHLALLALGIGGGDEVIIPDFTIIASASTVILTGARPVPVDVDPLSWTINPKLIEEKITPKTRAIMVVHMYGIPADMPSIMRIARRHNLAVVEDACMAHGVSVGGKIVGSIGDAGCFSFYSSKTIAAGEGGMVVTNSRKIAEKVRLLANQAFEEPRFVHRFLGFNYRLTDIQAAIGLAQLENIKKHLARKREISRNYDSLFENVTQIKKPPRVLWGEVIPWMYTILINDEFGKSRDEIVNLLKGKGIETELFFTPMSEQPVFKNRKDPRYPDLSSLNPVSRDLGNRGLYLPSGLNITFSEQKRVVDAIVALIKR